MHTPREPSRTDLVGKLLTLDNIVNQWVQQITVGGYKPTNDDTPEGGANKVTLLCLKAARRIPVNAPSLSLRVYKDMPEEYLHEAAKSILAGGAHPILYNDDRLCEGLHRSGSTITKAVSTYMSFSLMKQQKSNPHYYSGPATTQQTVATSR